MLKLYTFCRVIFLGKVVFLPDSKCENVTHFSFPSVLNEAMFNVFSLSTTYLLAESDLSQECSPVPRTMNGEYICSSVHSANIYILW